MKLDVYEIGRCSSTRRLKLATTRLLSLEWEADQAKAFFRSKGHLAGPSRFRGVRREIMDSGQVNGEIKYIAILDGQMYVLVKSDPTAADHPEAELYYRLPYHLAGTDPDTPNPSNPIPKEAHRAKIIIFPVNRINRHAAGVQPVAYMPAKE